MDDTWEWDGSEWVQTADTGPMARYQHAVAFDSNRKRTVLFGGIVGTQDFGDTWIWDGAEWTQEQDSGPVTRHGHALAYDVKRQRIVLFGGSETKVRLFDDTWEYDGTHWVDVADTGPSPRLGHGMVYGGVKVILFGGRAAAVHVRDTWEWDGTRWMQLQDMGPSPRRAFGMACDTVRQHVALFGGAGKDSEYLGDTWEWYDHAM